MDSITPLQQANILVRDLKRDPKMFIQALYIFRARQLKDRVDDTEFPEHFAKLEAAIKISDCRKAVEHLAEIILYLEILEP